MAKSMNEPETKKDESAESVADLPVSSVEAEEIQAGAESKGTVQSFHSFPGFAGGIFVAS
jgi:hypothetical protein